MSVRSDDLNIGFVHPNNNLTGQEFSLLERMQALRSINVASSLILPEQGAFADLVAKKGFDVHFCSMNRIKKVNPFPHLKTIKGITKLIKNNGFNVVHCSGLYPHQYCLSAARICDVPCVIHVNATVYNDYDISNNFINKTDHAFTVSESAKQLMSKLTELKDEQITCVYNPIELKESHQADPIGLRQKYNIPEDVRIVGQFAEVIERKGYECFIEMAKEIKTKDSKVKYFIVGKHHQDEYEERLRNLVATYHLQDDIVFAGFQKNYFEFLSMMDVTVLCSLSEGLARVVVESQKARKPVVGCDVDGINEVIEHKKTGMLAESKNAKQMADGVLYLLNNQEENKKITASAYMQAMQKFNTESHARALEKTYLYLLN